MPSSLTRKQTKTSWLLSMIKITLQKIQTARRLWRGSYSLLAVCPYKAIISFKCRINPFCGSSGWFRDAFGWNRPHLRVHQGLGIVKERWAIVYNLMLARPKELCNRCFSLSWHRSTEVVFIFVTLVQRDNLLIISSLERIWWRWAFQFQLFQFILKGCDISLFLYNILIIN